MLALYQYVYRSCHVSPLSLYLFVSWPSLSLFAYVPVRSSNSLVSVYFYLILCVCGVCFFMFILFFFFFFFIFFKKNIKKQNIAPQFPPPPFYIFNNFISF